MSTFAKAGTLYEIGLVSLGEAILKEGFRHAARVFLKQDSTIAVQQSVLFIRGSGVEATIATFGLSYDAERLRDTFFQWAVHSSAS